MSAAPLARGDLARAVELVAVQEACEPDTERRAAHRAVLGRVDALVARGASAGALLAALPPAFAAELQPFGWAWNGFYALGRDGRLHLGHAHGPPVCAELEARGGALSSGMCFDGVFLNQVLVAPDVKRWPGYVSCDAQSGLQTVGGIVCPVRDARGAPLGVWDLDATRPVTADDGRFVDALFGCLARAFALTATDLGAARG